MNVAIKTADGNTYRAITVAANYGDLVFPCVLLDDVAPHIPDIEFVIHKSATFENDWTVSEWTTGFAVLTADSFENAIELARAKLTSKSLADVRAAMDKTPAAKNARDAELARLAFA